MDEEPVVAGWGHRMRTGRWLRALCFGGGAAALSWEILWQHHASLSLGISALGTAITLAVTMGGMAIGSLGLARVLRTTTVAQPLRLYGMCEGFIGLWGLALGPAFHAIERLDTLAFRANPDVAPIVHLAGIAVALGPPAVAMGATIPALGLVARAGGAAV